jgi:plasmid stabilization system protein ParE
MMATDLIQLWANLLAERAEAQAAAARDELQAACDLAVALRDIPSKTSLDLFKAQSLANEAWLEYFQRKGRKPQK